MDQWLGGVQVRMHSQFHLYLNLVGSSVSHRKLITFNATSEHVFFWLAGFSCGFDSSAEAIFL